MKISPILQTLFLVLFLQGCTSNSTTRSNNQLVSINDVKAHPKKYQNTQVVWGGTILNIKNFSHYSLIEVLKRPLSGSEPNDRKRGQGRFLVKVNGFVDPAEYKNPSRITITGVLGGNQKGKVGGYLYTYPLVKASKVRFWSGKKEIPRRDPYWSDYPYYSPFPYSRQHRHWY